MSAAGPALWHEPRLPWLEILEGGEAVRLRLRTDSEARVVLVEFGDRYRPGLRRRALDAVGSAAGRTLWQAEIAMPTRRLRYRFLVGTGDGPPRRPATVWGREDFHQLPYAYPPPPPGPWPGATIYALFPDRFARSPGEPEQPLAAPRGYYGGTLAGILSRLDYLADLGVGAVYLNPIHPSHSYHRYDIEDYRAVDPLLGGLDDFRALAREIHGRGMRLVLDMVFNHTSDRHPWFVEARADPASPLRQRYRFLPDGTYETWADKVWSLPKLLWTPAVEREVGDILAFWRDLGADAFRLDVANEMPREGWLRIRERFPDIVLWGEVFPPAPEWVEDRPYTGVLDYTWLATVGKDILQGRSADRLAAAVLEHEILYGSRQHGANWVPLGSHDLPRPLTLARGRRDRVELAQIVQWASPGLPVLYYGDEQYMEGGPDPDCRRPFPWRAAEAHPQQDLVRRLVRWRRQSPWLTALPLARVEVQADTLVVARGPAGGARLLTLVRPAPGPGRVALPPGTWQDALDGERVAGRVPIGPVTARILVSEAGLAEANADDNQRL